MKRILLSIFLLITAQSMLAMEPEFAEAMKDNSEQLNISQPNLSQEERDTLGEALVSAIFHQAYDMALNLIERGANVNAHWMHGKPIETIFDYTKMTPEQNEQRIHLVQKLIQKGAKLDGKLVNMCTLEPDAPILQLLLDEGVDVFSHFSTRFADDCYLPLVWHARNCFAHLDFVQMIAQKAVSMTPGEINCIKGWLLACNRLKNNFKFKSLCTDLRKLIADMIIDGLAQDANDRLARAGALEAYYGAQESDSNEKGEIIAYLANVLDSENVRAYVRHQVLQAIRIIPFTRELTEDEAFGTFNNNNE